MRSYLSCGHIQQPGREGLKLFAIGACPQTRILHFLERADGRVAEPRAGQ
jgi:hypothetical protein